MASLSEFSSPSPLHRVKREPGGFSICPVDTTPIALSQFQSIARRAVSFVSDEFETIPHPKHSPYDEVMFLKLESTRSAA